MPRQDRIDPRLDPAVRRQVAALSGADANELRVGGLPVRALAERFGTQLYVFDQALLQGRAVDQTLAASAACASAVCNAPSVRSSLP